MISTIVRNSVSLERLGLAVPKSLLVSTYARRSRAVTVSCFANFFDRFGFFPDKPSTKSECLNQKRCRHTHMCSQGSTLTVFQNNRRHCYGYRRRNLWAEVSNRPTGFDCSGQGCDFVALLIFLMSLACSWSRRPHLQNESIQ